MMALHQFDTLSTRAGFNASLDHFKTVNDIIGEFKEYYNLADLMNELLEEKELRPVQCKPIVNALLVDKFNYFHYSINLKHTISDFEYISSEVAKWNAVDIVLAYFHPELGYSLINPKNQDHWKIIQSLKKNELLNVFIGAFDQNLSKKIEKAALDKLLDFIEGKKTKSPASLLDGDFEFNEETEAEEDIPIVKEKKVVQEISSSKKRMTPLYSVPVTNELFHNGNVEAWKKIIESYNSKYPAIDVYIFYDNERIHDINTLFKWGKVKHGSSILFQVCGEQIKDVAKLQRYLKQGASPQFESFLKFPVNKVLNLF